MPLVLECPDLATTPAPMDTPAPAGPRILLVEDSSTQRRVVSRLLAQAGYTGTFQAEDGVAALELLERTRPAAVLTDLFMPRMDGLELVERIRDAHPQLPVILMTSGGSERTAVAALKAGAADYVVKSHLAAELAGVLERVLAAAAVETDKLRLLAGLVGRSTRFSLENDPSLVAPLVAQLREELLAVGVCDKSDANRIGVALEEALLNAIYHGNLEISSELKKDGDAPFHTLARQRRFEAPYAARRVRVSVRISPAQATYRIRDEGPGFDISKLPDPTDPEYLERPSGRGLLLMRAFMDDVGYNATGNQVTMIKRK